MKLEYFNWDDNFSPFNTALSLGYLFMKEII